MKKLLLFIPFLLMGCSMTQKISYRTDNLAPVTAVTTFPILVDVQIFTDKRQTLKENEILFTQQRVSKVDGKSACLNSEKGYKKDSVSTQITRIMAEHFNKARLFSFASCMQGNLSEYYLTGTLNSFYGMQGVSTAARVGAQFGLIGALATAGAKTKGKIIIDISDIKLYKKDGTLVKDFGDFYKEYNEDLPADAYCTCIYTNANAKLKDYTSHLIEKIRTDLAGVTFPQ